MDIHKDAGVAHRRHNARAAVVYQSVSNTQEFKFCTFWKISRPSCKKQLEYAGWVPTKLKFPLASPAVGIGSVTCDTFVNFVAKSPGFDVTHSQATNCFQKLKPFVSIDALYGSFRTRNIVKFSK